MTYAKAKKAARAKMGLNSRGKIKGNKIEEYDALVAKYMVCESTTSSEAQQEPCERSMIRLASSQGVSLDEYRRLKDTVHADDEQQEEQQEDGEDEEEQEVRLSLHILTYHSRISHTVMT